MKERKLSDLELTELIMIHEYCVSVLGRVEYTCENVATELHGEMACTRALAERVRKELLKYN